MAYKRSHTPIFLKEFLGFFEGRQLKTFVDGTLGAGGHAEALLENHPEVEKFWGIDGDPHALEVARDRLKKFHDKLELVQDDFAHLLDWVAPQSVEGIFLDLGLSSMQLDEGEQGFAFSREAPLDMRRDPRSEVQAKEVVNNFSEAKLGEIFRELGEERRWRQAARAICIARKKKKINTTTELAAVLKPVLSWSGKKIHPLTLIFQALRIYVNNELESLEEGIVQSITALSPGGRLGIISFHSLEDRIVKKEFRKAYLEDKVVILTKKPLTPTLEEIKANPRARSAKVRFVEKL